MTIKTKGEIRISDKKKQVLDVFEKALPNMSDADIEKLLAFGEGVALMAERSRADRQQSSA